MQRYGQKASKMPQNGYFLPFVTPKMFFQKSGSVTFVPLWCPNFMKKIRKTSKRSLRYLKTDGRTNGPRTDMGNYIGPSRVNPGSNMSEMPKSALNQSIFLTAIDCLPVYHFNPSRLHFQLQRKCGSECT